VSLKDNGVFYKVVNIATIRAFVRLRQMLASNAALARKLEEMEKRYDERFKIVFEAIQQLMAPPETKKRKIYPVQSVAPPSVITHYQDGATTLELPHVINFI